MIVKDTGWMVLSMSPTYSRIERTIEFDPNTRHQELEAFCEALTKLLPVGQIQEARIEGHSLKAYVLVDSGD